MQVHDRFQPIAGCDAWLPPTIWWEMMEHGWREEWWSSREVLSANKSYNNPKEGHALESYHQFVEGLKKPGSYNSSWKRAPFSYRAPVPWSGTALLPNKLWLNAVIWIDAGLFSGINTPAGICHTAQSTKCHSATQTTGINQHYIPLYWINQHETLGYGWPLGTNDTMGSYGAKCSFVESKMLLLWPINLLRLLYFCYIYLLLVSIITITPSAQNFHCHDSTSQSISPCDCILLYDGG